MCNLSIFKKGMENLFGLTIGRLLSFRSTKNTTSTMPVQNISDNSSPVVFQAHNIILESSALKELVGAINPNPDFDKSRLAESRKRNIKEILKKADQEVDPKAEEPPEASWIGQFIEKCKDVSDKDLQDMWAALLASEISGKSKTSYRTMSVLSELSPEEAALFNRFLGFNIEGYVYYENQKGLY